MPKRRYCRVCRRVKCRCVLPDAIWVLFDADNGTGIEVHPDSKHYLWWFERRQSALRQLEIHRKNRTYTRLAGPFRYVREPKKGRK